MQDNSMTNRYRVAGGLWCFCHSPLLRGEQIPETGLCLRCAENKPSRCFTEAGDTVKRRIMKVKSRPACKRNKPPL